ncbi:NtaA/DmoA family FMN-dependent monooxygenase [Corynebacterium frankenforstense]|uniref:NtaA/DmoA family FMN-dependent monooxygenase n=1 Tax=Corynebacterium frankenforstense TaxID=1230998 RepID=UPI00254F92E6|nr:NtaA/DmoA family FMN-dependent monooxygenase [Corynebacterium frankenforstense]MDK6260846.1 NtaA/DmoA family FMN-dependent monooxygenase [Corynebacterium frankenforstense]
MFLSALDMLVPTHQSSGLWRHPDAEPEQYRDLDFWVSHARMLDEAGFDALFLADVAGIYDVYGGSGAAAIRAGMQYPLLDPMPLISALAAATRRLGFGVTANTSYESPYLLARRFATLDQLTGGRIAWNIVTGYQPGALRNIGAPELDHDTRYDRADEFAEVCYALWEGSIEPSALVSDAESGVYMDPAKVHPIEHKGQWFDVPGAAVSLPGPQRTPFLFQAGSSPRGLAFAARHAEALFFSGTTPDNVAPLVTEARRLLAEEGRADSELTTITSVTAIAAETDAAAFERYESYLRYVDQEAALALFAGWTGLDLSTYGPDDVLEDVEIQGNRSALQSFTSLDPTRRWTVGDLAAHMTIGGRGPVFVGSGATIADELERWLRESGVDGFNVDYALRGPDMRAFAEHVVPVLRARGLVSADGSIDDAAPRTLRARVTGSDLLPTTHPAARYRR